MVANDAFLTEEARRRQLDVCRDHERAKWIGGQSGRCRSTASMRRCSTARSNACRNRKRCSRISGDALVASGVVMIIAPTIDSRTARLFRSAWWEFNATNLHYFSADTLQSLLHQERVWRPDHRW